MRARGRRSAKSIDSKIEVAKLLLEKARQRYDRASSNLKNLMDLRDEQRKRELLEAIGKSDRTYEEILNFIRG
ncbi:hypothetical protein [Fibrobacter sp.]|uniref:hypothetical protein n=1 Tax=Fibrobacter sp. TaxID=35828 RepID=UPI00388FFCC6